MKIKLLKSGGFGGFDSVIFPAEVEARREHKSHGDIYYVHEREFERIGCDMSVLRDPSDPEWPFHSTEIEVVE